MEIQRAWDAVPSTALVNIFCRTPIKDRMYNLPLVCKSWADTCRNRQCWASMIPDSYRSSTRAFDDAFAKGSYPFEDPFDGRRSPDPSRGLVMLQSLIARAGGGAAVTSLYLFPFLTRVNACRPNDDALLHLIAQR